MDEHKNLIVACKHTIEGKTGYFVDEEEEIFVCDECDLLMRKLNKKYGNNVPVEEMDFLITVCRDCLFKNMKKI